MTTPDTSTWEVVPPSELRAGDEIEITRALATVAKPDPGGGAVLQFVAGASSFFAQAELARMVIRRAPVSPPTPTLEEAMAIIGGLYRTSSGGLSLHADFYARAQSFLDRCAAFERKAP